MNPNEIWQVDVNGQIYETSLDELKQWIIEGAVLRDDKIRRGNLRWLEAGKVPFLLETFNTSANGGMPQFQATVNEPPIIPEPNAEDLPTEKTATNFQNTNINQPNTTVNSFNQTETSPAISAPIVKDSRNFLNANPNVNNAGFCFIHPQEESKFVCETCLNEFCKGCPKTYGNASICPICGAICKSKNEQQKQVAKQKEYKHAITEGFGFGDFTKALAYPFKYPIALIIGGLIYGVLSIAQGALGMGSYMVAAGGIVCMIFANALTFGCLANTINEFSQGKFDTNFMSFFDDFDIWEAVVKPFFLTIGVYLISFGLLIAIILGGIYFASKSILSVSPMTTDLTPTQNQIQPVKDSLAILKQKDTEQKQKIAELMNESYKEGSNSYEANQKSSPLQTQNEEQQTQDLEKYIQDSRKKQLEATFGETPETKKAKQEVMIKNLVSYGLGFLGLAGIALLWAIFYYPAACLVAGYTQSFAAVVNPLVGLDTIKRLGGTYFKILIMSFLLSILAAIPMGIVSSALSAFNMPTVGNIPATFINGIIYFYFFIVFSATLGFAVYKNADKLAINQY